MLAQNVVELHDRGLLTSIEQFFTQKKQRNKNTFKSYYNDIDHFFNSVFGKSYMYVTEHEFNEKTTLEYIMAYFDELFYQVDDDGNRLFSNATINRKQSSVKGLLKFLKVKKAYIHDLSELDLIKNLPKETKTIEVISFEHAMEYAEWLKKNERFKGEEKYMIIKLAIDTGLRASELISLKWNQFTIEGETVLMNGYGKGNKKWIERINIDLYNELLPFKNDSEKVFSLSYSDLSKMMNRAKNALGDSDRAISFHSFKKCAVSSVFKMTGNILKAQNKGKHNSILTTRIYLENEDYGMTGIVSLGGEIDDKELYKKVDKKTLLKAIESMNKDFLFVLNSKIKELQK